ncbi:peptide ABC transporter substrate-binding protein [Sphingosinicella sp. YJ22]|uniref:peptide ABC transporter substrate-binding protein n=1 Tax=Sphingosinicella sp. YJ22 TaxID=1104780 RepID=UPI001A9CB890|nr:peptide ABC transporter substrate-binding protein [Sphingosinicella sp. YJ22]
MRVGTLATAIKAFAAQFSSSFLSVAIVAICFTVVACGTREREVDIAAKNGILLMGNGAEPKALDPHLVTGVPENRIISSLMEGLISYHPSNDLEPEPGVAERWEHNADFTVWRFQLRENARWSNGEPVTAGDFVYSWQRILSPALGAEYASMLYVIRNAEAFHQGQINDFSQVGVRALNPRTLEVTLAGPTPYFLNMLKHYSFFPVNPRVVERFGGMTNRQNSWSTAENYVGNGPFRLTQWTTNQVIKVAKSPTYWDAARVRLNEIHFFPIENVRTEETAFLAGRLHLTSTVSPDRIPTFQRENAEQLKIDPYLGLYFFRINVTREPFNDPRVREALNLAIDRRMLVERVTQGGQAPASGIVPPGLQNYPASQQVQFNLQRARQLLAEAGFPGGRGFPRKEILINTSEAHRKIAEAIQAMWRENLGIDVGIYNQEWKVYLDSQSQLNYDLSRAGWIADYAYPMTFLEIFTTGNGNNDTGWSNAQYDALIQQARTASTEPQRMQLMQQAERLLLTELPVIPIYWYTRIYLKDPRVQGWNPTLLDNRPYKYVSISSG